MYSDDELFYSLKNVSYDLNSELLNSIEKSMIELFTKEQQDTIVDEKLNKLFSTLIDLHHRMKNYSKNEQLLFDLISKIFLKLRNNKQFTEILKKNILKNLNDFELQKMKKRKIENVLNFENKIEQVENSKIFNFYSSLYFTIYDKEIDLNDLKNEFIFCYFTYENPKESVDIILKNLKERIKETEKLIDLDLVLKDFQQFKKFIKLIDLSKEFTCLEWILKKFNYLIDLSNLSDFELLILISNCFGFLNLLFKKNEKMLIAILRKFNFYFNFLNDEEYNLYDPNYNDSIEFLNFLLKNNIKEMDQLKYLFKNLNFIYSINLNTLFSYLNNNEENKMIFKKLIEIIGIKKNEFVSIEILIHLLKNFEFEIEYIQHLFNIYSIHFNQFSKNFFENLFLNLNNNTLINNLIQWIDFNNHELKFELINHWKLLFSILQENEKIFDIYLKIFKNIIGIEYSITNSFTHALITLFFFISDKNNKSKIKKILSFLIKIHPKEIFNFLFEFILSKHNKISNKDPSIILFENTKQPFIEFESLNDLLNFFLNDKIINIEKRDSDSLILNQMKEKKISILKKKKLKEDNFEIEILDLLSHLFSSDFQFNLKIFSNELYKRLESFLVIPSIEKYKLPKKPTSKYDLYIDKLFSQYPIFYSFFLFISESPFEILKFYPIILSALSNLIGDWNSYHSMNQEILMENTIQFLKILNKSQFLIYPLTNFNEIIFELNSNEIILILIDLFNFIIQNPPKLSEYEVLKIGSNEIFKRKFNQNIKIENYSKNIKNSLRNHVEVLSVHFSKFF
eukprot:gene205-4451_t